MTALFRLEKSRTLGDTQALIQALTDWLAAPEQTGLRRAFAVWIKRVLLPGRLPGVALPDITDLNEVQTMLADNTIDWTTEWMQRGERAVLSRQLMRRLGLLP